MGGVSDQTERYERAGGYAAGKIVARLSDCWLINNSRRRENGRAKVAAEEQLGMLSIPCGWN